MSVNLLQWEKKKKITGTVIKYWLWVTSKWSCWCRRSLLYYHTTINTAYTSSIERVKVWSPGEIVIWSSQDQCQLFLRIHQVVPLSMDRAMKVHTSTPRQNRFYRTLQPSLADLGSKITAHTQPWQKEAWSPWPWTMLTHWWQPLTQVMYHISETNRQYFWSSSYFQGKLLRSESPDWQKAAAAGCLVIALSNF